MKIIHLTSFGTAATFYINSERLVHWVRTALNDKTLVLMAGAVAEFSVNETPEQINEMILSGGQCKSETE
jgi:hypothetical protein